MPWLSPPAGLDGHIRRNRLRLIVPVLAFVGAAQLSLLPLLWVAQLIFPFGAISINPVDLALRYGAPVALAASAVFVIRWRGFPKTMGAKLGAGAEASDNRRLQRLVRELAVLNGLPIPRVVEIKSGALNAFAAGLGSGDAAIFVTSSLEAALDDAELKAVLAHEMAHLASGDTRVMAASAVMIDTIDAVRRRMPWRNGLGWKSGVLLLLLPPVGLIIKMLAGASALADMLTRGGRLSVAASRERIADAEAVRMTRDPAALIAALRKIEGRSGVGAFPRAIEAMLIDGPAYGPEATHPPMAERIAAIAALTGAYFPLPSDLRMPASPSPRKARSIFGQRTAPVALLPDIVAGTAFGRVRRGQGNLIKTTRSYRLAPYAMLPFVLLAMMNAMRARDAASHPDDGTLRSSQAGIAGLAGTFAVKATPVGAIAPKDPRTSAPASPSGRTGSPTGTAP